MPRGTLQKGREWRCATWHIAGSRRPLTPALSPEYWGEGETIPTRHSDSDRSRQTTCDFGADAIGVEGATFAAVQLLGGRIDLRITVLDRT